MLLAALFPQSQTTVREVIAIIAFSFFVISALKPPYELPGDHACVAPSMRVPRVDPQRRPRRQTRSYVSDFACVCVSRTQRRATGLRPSAGADCVGAHKASSQWAACCCICVHPAVQVPFLLALHGRVRSDAADAPSINTADRAPSPFVNERPDA